MRWRGEIVASDDVRLAARYSGGDGRSLLLIHGLGLTQRAWGRLAARLSKRFRIVTYDQRGHGASSGAVGYPPAAFVRDLEAVIAALGIQDAVLVGHSMGGHLAVEYAAGHPDCAGVVGIEGGFPVDLPAVDRAPPGGGGASLVLALARAAGKLARRRAGLPFEDMERLVDEHDPWLRGLGAAYERISCPVLLLVGSEPDRVPQGAEIRAAVRRGVHALQEAHPEVTVEWLPGGHFVHLERPSEVAASIERFLRTVG